MKANRPAVPLRKNVPAKPQFQKTGEPGFFLKNKELFLLTLVLIITFFIYFPARHHQFTNWDDSGYVADNPYIKALTPANIGHIFTKPIASNYHPLTILSLALNYQVAGEEPFSYFLVNILLHLCNIVLVFWFAFLILGRNRPLALFVAAIFAVHPMHVESVAWISERKEVLYAFFFLSSLIAWLGYVDKRKWTLYLFSLVLFLFAGLSKPSAVVLPLILFLADFLYKRKLNLALIAEKIPFFVLSAWIGIATIYAQLNETVVSIRNYNLVQQILFASYGFFIYILKLFVPTGLSALHPVPVFNTSLDLPVTYFAAPFIVVVLTGLILWSLKSTRILFFGFIFYFLNVVLTLQFMQVGSAVFSERYTYVSYIGLLICLAWLMNRASERSRVNIGWMYAIMVFFFGINTLVAAERVPVWKNSETLWTDVIAKYPGNDGAYNSRGWYYLTEKMYDKAVPDLTRAIEINPRYLFACYNRGNAWRKQNLYRLAIADFNRALAIDSNYILAISDRGSALFALGILDSALADFNRALKLDPAYAIGFANRASVLYRMGKYSEAAADYSHALAINPGDAETHLNRGVAYSSMGKWDLAINDYTFMLKSSADNPSVYGWRGIAYRNSGALQPAIKDFTEGIRLNNADPMMFLNRSMAYELAGMHQQALDDIATANKLGANLTEKEVFSSLKQGSKQTDEGKKTKKQ